MWRARFREGFLVGKTGMGDLLLAADCLLLLWLLSFLQAAEGNYSVLFLLCFCFCFCFWLGSQFLVFSPQECMWSLGEEKGVIRNTDLAAMDEVVV